MDPSESLGLGERGVQRVGPSLQVRGVWTRRVALCFPREQLPPTQGV